MNRMSELSEDKMNVWKACQDIQNYNSFATIIKFIYELEKELNVVG